MSNLKEPVHLAKLLIPHAGKWIALSQDEKRILGIGETIDQALIGATQQGEKKPILIKSPDRYAAALL